MNKHDIAGIFIALMVIACIAPTHAGDTGMTDKQKLSYALGVFFSQSVVQQKMDLNEEYFLMAVEDVLKNNKPKLSQEEIQTIFARFQEQEQEKRNSEAVKNSRIGKKFLDENKTKESIVALDSGLQYKILRPGEGKSPDPDSEITVHYRGTLINGEEFDSSYARNAPAKLTLNRVIKGWQQALPLMKTGAKWQLYIPAELAYGPVGQGSIGPNETLIFDIELIAVH